MKIKTVTCKSNGHNITFPGSRPIDEEMVTASKIRSGTEALLEQSLKLARDARARGLPQVGVINHMGYVPRMPRMQQKEPEHDPFEAVEDTVTKLCWSLENQFDDWLVGDHTLKHKSSGIEYWIGSDACITESWRPRASHVFSMSQGFRIYKSFKVLKKHLKNQSEAREVERASEQQQQIINSMSKVKLDDVETDNFIRDKQSELDTEFKKLPKKSLLDVVNENEAFVPRWKRWLGWD